jgi:hypothetical protein
MRHRRQQPLQLVLERLLRLVEQVHLQQEVRELLWQEPELLPLQEQLWCCSRQVHRHWLCSQMFRRLNSRKLCGSWF